MVKLLNLSKSEIEKIAECLLELASEQRLGILILLQETNMNISKIAKELEATPPEIHRNATRLLKSSLIKKTPEGDFALSVFGKVACNIFPLYKFISENNDFFEDHDFSDLDPKFIQRLGALSKYEKIKGFVNSFEKWTEIHQNSKKYVYNLLPEIPYNSEITETIEKKLKSGIKIRSIFAQSTIVPKERKEIFKKKNFQNYVVSGNLKRRMVAKFSIVTLLNESEAILIFPNKRGEPDLSEIFYSANKEFHDWCYDYFISCWNEASPFQEEKLYRK